MPRREYNNLMQDMQTHIDAANAARAANNEADYRTHMDAANALRPRLEQLQNDLRTLEFTSPGANPPAGVRDMTAVQDLATQLAGGARVSLTEIRNALGVPVVQNAVLVSSSTPMPTGVSPEVRGGNTPMSNIIPRTTIEDMTELGSMLIPYVKAEMEADDGNVIAKSGKDRQDDEPEFGYVKLMPHEVTVTTYADRNLSKLTPVKFLEKVLRLAERALIRKENRLAVRGDGQGNPDIQGIINAKDVAGNDMVSYMDISVIDENTLSKIVFSYGGSESLSMDLGEAPELHLTKADLEAFSLVSGLNEKGSVYNIVPTDGTGNTGYISKGAGLPVRYVVNNNLTPLATANAEDAVMFYGDPHNYSYGSYGNPEIRLDFSAAAVKRLVTILVDGLMGGAVSVPNGFTVFRKAAAQAAEPDAEQAGQEAG